MKCLKPLTHMFYIYIFQSQQSISKQCYVSMEGCCLKPYYTVTLTYKSRKWFKSRKWLKEEMQNCICFPGCILPKSSASTFAYDLTNYENSLKVISLFKCTFFCGKATHDTLADISSTKLPLIEKHMDCWLTREINNICWHTIRPYSVLGTKKIA